MNEHDALLWAVLVDPSDDTPRLVYADWLADNGQPDRAEFVRVQVKLAQWPCDDCDTHTVLRRQEYELWREHGAMWSIELPADLYGPIHYPGCRVSTGEGNFIFRRGFIESVALQFASFTRDVARSLFKAHPITQVTFSDVSSDILNELSRMTVEWGRKLAELPGLS